MSGSGRALQILQVLVIAFLCLPLLAQFMVAGTHWPMGDMQGYWDAGLRLRAGEPLYNPPPPGVVDQLGVYRHAPWFALTWVPLTFLPHGVVTLAWGLAICAAIAYMMWSLATPLTPAGVAAALLIGWLTLQTGMFGNVQSLMVAGLVWGLPRRSGPLWIAVAASLKITPLLFVLAYARQREWRRVAWTLGLTILLWAPALVFNWQDIGGKGVEPWWPWIIAPALGLWWWRPSLLGAVVIAAYPLLHTSYVSYLAVPMRVHDAGEVELVPVRPSHRGGPGHGVTAVRPRDGAPAP